MKNIRYITKISGQWEITLCVGAKTNITLKLYVHHLNKTLIVKIAFIDKYLIEKRNILNIICTGMCDSIFM